MNKQKIIQKRRGSEAIENILMMGIAVSIIVVVFYPQLSSLMQTTFSTLETWFSNVIGNLAT